MSYNLEKDEDFSCYYCISSYPNYEDSSGNGYEGYASPVEEIDCKRRQDA